MGSGSTLTPESASRFVYAGDVAQRVAGICTASLNGLHVGFSLERKAAVADVVAKYKLSQLTGITPFDYPICTGLP